MQAKRSGKEAVEGEFVGGREAGWMYRLFGEEPNQSCKKKGYSAISIGVQGKQRKLVEM